MRHLRSRIRASDPPRQPRTAAGRCLDAVTRLLSRQIGVWTAALGVLAGSGGFVTLLTYAARGEPSLHSRLFFLRAAVAETSSEARPAVQDDQEVAAAAGQAADRHAGEAADSAADPARRLVEAIVGGDFEDVRDVAEGRFLRNFAATSVLELARTETAAMRPRRRGPGWIQVQAPWRPHDDSRAGTALMRFVEMDGRWKLEDFKVVDRALAVE